MKKLILLISTFIIIGCSSDRDDSSVNSNNAEYVGKWYFTKLTTYTNGNLSGSKDLIGTCEGKSFFNISQDRKIDYDGYTNQYISNNNYECKLDKKTGIYDDKNKKLILNDGYNYKDGSVTFMGSQMRVTDETTITYNGTTTTLKSILTLQK